MASSIDIVRDVIVESLDLPRTPADLTRETALFGALPELDSFGVVQLVTAIEDRFNITIDDDEFGAEMFETVGTLTDFVDAKLS